MFLRKYVDVSRPFPKKFSFDEILADQLMGQREKFKRERTE